MITDEYVPSEGAVRDVLYNPIHLTGWDDPLVPAEHVRRALEG